MCKDLKLRIYAVVSYRPSTSAEIDKILGLSAKSVDTALPGMDKAGLLLFEDDDGNLYPVFARVLIPAKIFDECAALVDAFEQQMPLPDVTEKSDV